MDYHTECKEAAERIFYRVGQHLLAIRDRFPKLEGIDCGLGDENNALIDALEHGDAMQVESRLYDIDQDRALS